MFSKIHSLFSVPDIRLAGLGFADGDINIMGALTAFAILFSLEIVWGHQEQSKAAIRQSYLTNLGLFIVNDFALSLLSVSSLLLLAQRWSHWGLLGLMMDSFWKGLWSFVLLDLTLYLWHRANHGLAWLWGFHKVHHSDRCMNVSTAFRLHFFEVLLGTLVKAVFIMMVGVNASTVMMNEMVITLFVMFHHANISFKAEAWLGRLLIVPSLHRLHHSAIRKEHDTNYGAVLSCWDSLFGSLSHGEPGAIGLKNIKPMGLLELLQFGFALKRPSTAPLPFYRPLQRKQ